LPPRDRRPDRRPPGPHSPCARTHERPHDGADREGRRQGGDRCLAAGPEYEGDRVKYIDPHIHMVSRTTDDYQRMAQCGCVAMTEPAFWAGYDRSSPQGFFDYFRQLTEYEPRRAALYGIDHYCWLCINSKE